MADDVPPFHGCHDLHPSISISPSKAKWSTFLSHRAHPSYVPVPVSIVLDARAPSQVRSEDVSTGSRQSIQTRHRYRTRTGTGTGGTFTTGLLFDS